LNKADLPAVHAAEPGNLLDRHWPAVAISTRSGEGLRELTSVLYEQIAGRSESAAEPALVTIRQLDALRRALSSIEDAQAARALHVPLDLVAVDVRTALYAVGEITGEHISEAVLDEIFSRFCIGK
jgi:tRNA modification GTPase